MNLKILIGLLMLGSIFVTNTDVIILMWFAAAALAIKEFILKW